MDTRGIAGYARTLRELLSNKRYGLEFYQREYGWGRGQVAELITDLSARFGDEFDGGHSRPDVAGYRQYFLGPIITSDKDGTSYLIDGQQRLTTLTLLLIALLHRLEDVSQRATVQSLIYTEEYGRKSLTVDVPEREPALRALIDGTDYDTSGASASVLNVLARYDDLVELLELSDEQLPLFTDWLINKVILVEIISPESDMAYDIFETMNDRGLRLTPTDMLKGYLLASIRDNKRIGVADEFWRQRVQILEEARNDGDVDFFKAWLRASYGETIRERKRGASSEDWDLIGTQFHKWVRDNRETVGLKAPSDFDFFVTHSFDRMSSHYLRMLEAAQRVTPGLEHVRYTAATGYSLQFTVALAPIEVSDDDQTATRKIELVARYLDIFIARRILNYRNYGYSPTYYTMFQLARRIRHAPLDELPSLLAKEAADSDEELESRGAFGLHMRNGPQVKYILARLTDHAEQAVRGDTTFDSLMARDRSDPYEIEHIWANHFQRHQDEFDHEQDFATSRNQLGDLLLLPKTFNASYGDLPYEEKVKHYQGQNVLAASLNAGTHEHNPNLRRYQQQTGVDLRPHAVFDTAALEKRQAAYLTLAGHIWDSRRLLTPESDDAATSS